MSLHFSANQFEDAYVPQRLSNWQVPKSFPERPRIRHGATRVIADDAGHFMGHQHSSSPGRKNSLHLRFQSAPVPKSNGLFISGSAVTTAKPARVAKINLGQRTTQPTEASTSGRGKNQAQDVTNGDLNNLAEEDEEEEEEARQESGGSLKSFHLLTSSTLPDNPRKAAIVLAARQKNHRPLPDLMLESRDVLIPRGWNQPGATAMTVETTKAKGPTSCTKRTIMRLLPEGSESELHQRRPNVMELAIKWDVNSPPPSAGSSRKKAVKPAMGARPVEKTLEWLYDQPVIHRTTVKRPEVLRRNKPIENTVATTPLSQQPPDSGNSSRNGSTTSSNGRPCPLGDRPESDPESGYNSPRSADGEGPSCPPMMSSNVGGGNKVAAGLTGLDEPVKAAYRSAASSAATIPPKNHFLVSTSDFAGRRNSNNESVILPEYPLQRRSPVQQSIVQPTKPQQHQQPIMDKRHHHHHQSSDYSPPDHHNHHHHHHQCDRSDSGIGDLHDRAEEEDEEYEDQEEEEAQQPSRQLHQQYGRPGKHQHQHRSRPCLACSNGTKHNNNNNKGSYKLAMKAGTPSSKNHQELEKVIQRRQSYRAPKPVPLTSHARHIRGTLAPPLSAGVGIEPIVDYPDFKRLASTYRLSYGIQQQPQLHHRRRPKTLTALLNEKPSRQWKS